jgi:hypothetical protein
VNASRISSNLDLRPGVGYRRICAWFLDDVTGQTPSTSLDVERRCVLRSGRFLQCPPQR